MCSIHNHAYFDAGDFMQAIISYNESEFDITEKDWLIFRNCNLINLIDTKKKKNIEGNS